MKKTSHSSTLMVSRNSSSKAGSSRLLPTRLRFPVSLNGTVFNAVSGHPLVGVGVKLWRGEAISPAGRKISSRRREDKKAQFFGEGRTDTSGCFIIRLAEASGIKENILTFKKEPKLLFTLVVEGQGGKELASHQFSLRDLSLSVAIPVSLPDVRIPASIWRTIAQRVGENRIGQLHDLLRELVLLPPEHSLFGDLNLETRHGLARAIEQAFLDPTGLLRSRGLTPSFYALRTQTSVS